MTKQKLTPAELGYELTVATDVTRALEEDIGSGDLTAALVPATQQAKATGGKEHQLDNASSKAKGPK